MELFWDVTRKVRVGDGERDDFMMFSRMSKRQEVKIIKSSSGIAKMGSFELYIKICYKTWLLFLHDMY